MTQEFFAVPDGRLLRCDLVDTAVPNPGGGWRLGFRNEVFLPVVVPHVLWMSVCPLTFHVPAPPSTSP